MTHPNQTAWDATVLAKLQMAPYSTMTDNVAIATALNALTVTGPSKIVSKQAVLNYLREASAWQQIVNAASTNAAAWNAVDLANDVAQIDLDLTLPIMTTMLGTLVETNLLNQTQSNAIMAMSQTTIPWWQSIGAGSPLNEHDIVRAMEN